MYAPAAMELQRHLDETGVHRVYTTIYVGDFRVCIMFDSGLLFEKSLPNVNFLTFRFTPSLHGLHKVYTKFTLHLHPNRNFFWEKITVGKFVNI